MQRLLNRCPLSQLQFQNNVCLEQVVHCSKSEVNNDLELNADVLRSNCSRQKWGDLCRRNSHGWPLPSWKELSRIRYFQRALQWLHLTCRWTHPYCSGKRCRGQSDLIGWKCQKNWADVSKVPNMRRLQPSPIAESVSTFSSFKFFKVLVYLNTYYY